ncbi:MAG TPA: hypothetical protein ENL03_06480, partial [Phycisphaerae bacterium]|nr:hypothetical protein [Phycisphaerae bacterium]
MKSSDSLQIKSVLAVFCCLSLCIAGCEMENNHWPKPAKQLDDGPFEHQLVTDSFEMSRDFAFDGQGNIIGRKGVGMIFVNGAWLLEGNQIIKVVANIRSVSPSPDKGYYWEDDSPHGIHGQRFRANGDYVFANPIGKPAKRKMGVTSYHPGRGHGSGKGMVAYFLMPQYVHTDRSGNIWYTGSRSGRSTLGAPEATINIVDVDNKYTCIYKGKPLDKPRGIVYDSIRSVVYYTEEETHKVLALPYRLSGKAGDIREIASLPTGPARNIVLDEYGNLYACSGDWVYRLKLDDKGDMIGKPIVLNKLPMPRAASANFGHGRPWDRNSLYVICEPESWRLLLGTVANIPKYASPLYKLQLGVAGDSDAQMDPAKFDKESLEGYDKLIAKKLEKYPQHLSEIDENVKQKLWVKNNPISDSKAFQELAKLGATWGMGLNHDPMLMLNGKGLTGNEPELKYVMAVAEDCHKRKACRAAPYGQHPATGWSFCINVSDNPDMVNFDFLQGLKPLDIMVDNCKNFDNK